MVIKTQIVVFWVVTPCGDVVGYRCFGGTCASIFRVRWRLCCPTTSLYGFTTKKNTTWNEWSHYLRGDFQAHSPTGLDIE